MGRVVKSIHLQNYAHNLKQKGEDLHMTLSWENSFSPVFPVRAKFFQVRVQPLRLFITLRG